MSLHLFSPLNPTYKKTISYIASQRTRAVETPTSSDKSADFMPKAKVYFLIVESSIFKVRCRKARESLAILAQSC